MVDENSARSAVASAAEIEAKAQAEIVRGLYRSAGPGLIVNAVVTVLVSLALGWRYEHPGVWPWLVAINLMIAVRLVLGRMFKQKNPPDAALAGWLRVYQIGACLNGALWGWAVWVFWSEQEMIPRLMLVFVAAGMNAGAAARMLATLPGTFVIYALVSLSPLVVRLSQMSVDGRWMLIGMIAIFVVFLQRAVAEQRRDMLGLHRARFENEALLEKLRAEKLRAEAGSRAKSEFLASMSHEIRTPMNGVLGMLQILQESDLDEEQRLHADMAFKSAECLMKMLDDVLDLAEAENGRINLERVGFEPETHLRNMAGLLEPLARQKGLVCRLVTTKPLPACVLGDPARLRQVLAILVGNAIKFTDRGAVEIGLRAEVLTGEDVRLYYSVADTGIGMDEATRANLFQAFFIGDSKSTRRFGGVGLGLATAQHLVRRMGGDISVESKPGMGARFSFAINVPVTSRVGGHRVAR